MACTGKMKSVVVDDDGAPEEELELDRFDDFTLASSWERFISDIEAICRQWIADGPKNLLEKGAIYESSCPNLYSVKSEMKYALKSYLMEYFFEASNDGKMAEWDCSVHDLQLCFGVKDFLVIAPQSASGVILDAPESSKLLSAVAIALSNCSSTWPAFVPVHDPSRKAYIGIQNMDTVFTRRFEADHIGSQVPVKLMHLEGLHELFVSKFAYSTMDLSVHVFQVHFTMKLTYQTLATDEEDDMQGADSEFPESGERAGDNYTKSMWDDDCPWSEWYSAENPVKGFKLIAIWNDKIVESALEMAELENASPHEAEKLILSPRISRTLGNNLGFAFQLSLLVDALDMSFEAQFMEDFTSVERVSTDNSSMVTPPPTVVDRVLKELFQDGTKAHFFNKIEHKSSRVIKGAPLESLFAQFCLNSLWIGNCNIRAIAVLWIEFVREVRFCWEESLPLPRMPSTGSIDLCTCIINQKLHMLAICIDRKQQLNEEFQDCIGSEDSSVNMEENDQYEGDPSILQQTVDFSKDKYNSIPSTPSNVHHYQTNVATVKPEDFTASANPDSLDYSKRGSAGVVGSMMLLKSRKSMHIPYTQEAPLMTEDMHEERLQAVDALGESLNFSAQLEKEILNSDMSAFKAANPDAVFEDFIRWHSPGDWEDEELVKESGSSSSLLGISGSKDEWPPQGHLSRRMSEKGNLWRKIWDDAPAIPASDQKPLLDPNREGEKILHYLETVRPHQLLEQMVCTSFRAAADTINQTNFGGLKLMATRMDQLYLTMASMLKFLQANRLSAGSETINDLRRLCSIFGNVEKLMTVAASLHRKFQKAPALSQAIFTDYCKFHAKTMGMGSKEEDGELEFEMTLQLKNNERQVISDLFTPPTANQSWRKVLSMGNLLNGHEPVVRELVFSKRDTLSGNHYAAGTPRKHQGEEELETYRMYICGTSNDLRAALSVASCD